MRQFPIKQHIFNSMCPGKEILNLITGDWVMTYPYYVDACLDNRGENYFQGSVVFKVTKNNLEIINNLSNSYEIFNAVNTLKDM